MLGYTPPGSRHTPGADPPPPGTVHAERYGQQVGGTHPNGMHTCFDDKIVVLWALPLCDLIEICLLYRVSFNIIARSD